MRSSNRHLKLLALILFLLGIGITAYQIFIQKLPISEKQTNDIWNIDAKIDFQATPNTPIKIEMYIPPMDQNYIRLNESFISNNYGVSINLAQGNRISTWSSRRASGKQTHGNRITN